MANIYLEAFKAIRAGSTSGFDYPTVDDGVIGMAFIETVLASTESEKKWIRMLK
jgi:hypothetical protein